MARSNPPGGETRRRGKPTPTSDEPHARRTSVSLGDITDLHAYVSTIVRTLTNDAEEFDDLLNEGIALAYAHAASLPPGESVSRALSCWLESRLRDEWRKRHREFRRNTRGGTTYSLPAPTGLAWEHDANTSGMPAVADTELIQSRVALTHFQSQVDLYNPRLVGRYLGVPSAAAIATARAAEIWATIKEERDLTTRKPFRTLTSRDEL